jgi:6-pyruvoyltetrahydropterin/6-carboxytetrahydropterin synthase
VFTLRRTVRCSILPPGSRTPEPGTNGSAGSPPFAGLARYYEIQVECRGELHDQTAYLVDIKDVDRAVREGAVPIITDACDHNPATDPASILPAMVVAIAARLDAPIHAVTWRLTPTFRLTTEHAVPPSTTVLMAQRFDFAAAHRLHSPSLSVEENRRVYGRCNNPNGHGHNYAIEPIVAIDLADPARPSLADLERLTHEVLITRFDHKHLNLDTPEFGEHGVIPSVENIARVFFDLLAPRLAAVHPRATLRSITVWETDRTCATYPA